MKNESLKLQAYNLLKEKVILCKYAPGSQLNEEFLQKELGMSRTPIRDALSRLEQEGLIAIRPKKGITVAQLSIKELNMIFELRQLLECYALENYGEMLDENVLLNFYRRFLATEAMDEEAYYALDDAFHAVLVGTVPNLYIARSYQQITDQNTRFRILTGLRTNERLGDTSKEHLAIITACMKRDWRQASEAMRSHLNTSKAAAFDLLLEQNVMF